MTVSVVTVVSLSLKTPSHTEATVRLIHAVHFLTGIWLLDNRQMRNTWVEVQRTVSTEGQDYPQFLGRGESETRSQQLVT